MQRLVRVVGVSNRCALGSAVLLCAAVAAAAGPEPVQARLVSDRAGLEPGGTIEVGVLFAIAPGWHIYWKNPGDDGLATEVRLQLPDEFSAGPLRWPLPERIAQPGDLTAYGYHGSALLAARVRLPESLPEEVPPIRAAVSWLACREKCILGGADLELRLPAPAAAVDAGAFARWREELPLPADAPGLPFELTVLGGLAPGDREGRLSLWLRWRESPPRAVELFPENVQRLAVSGVRVQTRGDLTRIEMTLRTIGRTAERARLLPALLVATGDRGSRRGYELELPLSESS